MFKTRNLIAAVVATVAMGTLVTSAFADDAPTQPPAEHMHKGPHGPHDGWMMFKDLNLTDAQKAQIKQLMQANRSAMQQQMQGMKASHDQEQALLFSSDYSDAKADQLAQADAQQMVAGRAARLKFQHQLYAVLTPAQQQQLQAKMKEREAKWAQHRADHAKPGDAQQ
ncbi:Spy/CpxP family protein refolding chaperone [Silvimonas sp.]|uniref:Spy/CpxP family protein refolding chaperone n=1 Tax=Silvimonas sp. TaxID=2650811 RepID=UPI00283BACC0|nr:Spy/CpxP family protein refolding chaperone [Silvimonas sp.]MDR3425985.1 Spy/CpxP family protein refolding chaperone [Silvimonas sp.]